jgi:hypothetical protein
MGVLNHNPNDQWQQDGDGAQQAEPEELPEERPRQAPHFSTLEPVFAKRAEIPNTLCAGEAHEE